ncbi:zinc finger BED domain-containing protein RICESLEEPER 2-like protein [Tanacetum coccineum]
MQDTSATNPVSPMYGSTINPMQSGGENCVEVDGQSSQQSEHEYINLDDETVPTQDTNEDLGERDIGNNNGEDELELKTNEVANNTKEVSDALDHMFKEYVEMHDELVREAASHKNRSCGESTNLRSNKDLLGSEWEKFRNFYKGADVEKCDKSELKMYLDEGLLEGHWRMKFNALEWWNIHQLKYPVLLKMARDVLVIPVSTVASEATFSAGGRVIDPY